MTFGCANSVMFINTHCEEKQCQKFKNDGDVHRAAMSIISQSNAKCDHKC